MMNIEDYICQQDKKPSGYWTDDGYYMGLVDGNYILFVSFDEYLEYFLEDE